MLVLINISFVLLISLNIQDSAGMTCYICHKNDEVCMGEGKGEKVDCPKKFCTIYRHEMKDPQGVVIDFKRDCLDTPLHENAIVETAEHIEYYKSCRWSLCNNGTGTDALTDESVSRSPPYLFVPGIGKSFGSQTRPFNWHSYICVIFALNFLRNW